jgi:hypothetical protein
VENAIRENQANPNAQRPSLIVLGKPVSHARWLFQGRSEVLRASPSTVPQPQSSAADTARSANQQDRAMTRIRFIFPTR